MAKTKGHAKQQNAAAPAIVFFSFASLDSANSSSSSPEARATVPARHPERGPVLGRVELLEHQVGEVGRQVAPHSGIVVFFFFSFSASSRALATRQGEMEKKTGVMEKRRKKTQEKRKSFFPPDYSPLSAPRRIPFLSLALGILAS